MFAPYLGAIIGTGIYVIFIGLHVPKEDNNVEEKEYKLFKTRRKVSMAKFVGDDIEEDSLREYRDKIYS